MRKAITVEGWSPPFATARSPLVIRSVGDIQKLLASPRVAKQLPRAGLVIAIPGLDETTKDEFQRQLNRYVRACGCTAGGATFLVASAVFIVYAIGVALNDTWADRLLTILAGLIGVPILAAMGKLLGLYVARLRFRRSCARVIRSLSEHRTVLSAS